jgi:hypothetical protein
MEKIHLLLENIFKRLPFTEKESILLMADKPSLLKFLEEVFQPSKLAVSYFPLKNEKNVFENSKPFHDQSFKALVCMDIPDISLENPCRFFYTAASWLKPGGFFIFVCKNIFLKILNNFDGFIGENFEKIEELWNLRKTVPHSIPGFTLEEIQELAAAANLSILRLWTQDLTQKPPELFLKESRLSNLMRILLDQPIGNFSGDHIVLIAQRGDFIRYPFIKKFFNREDLKERLNSNLFIKDAAKPYIVMGENDHVQLGEGWYPLEYPPFFRWSKEEASLSLKANKEKWIFLNFYAEKKKKIELISEQESLTFETSRGNQEIWLQIQPKSGIMEIKLKTQAWIPSEQGSSEDTRELGIALKGVHLSHENEKFKKEEEKPLEKMISGEEIKGALSRNHFVPWAKCGESIILGKPRDGGLIQLDGTARWIWGKIEEPCSVLSLINAYALENEFSFTAASEEVLKQIGFLYREGFIQIEKT